MNDTRKLDDPSGAPYIVNGKELVSSPAGSLMYDKIINVKFIRKYPDAQGNRYFCVRSDYEPVYHRDGTMEFVKCAFKPSITVSYNQVADSIAVGVTIKVEALYIDREKAGEEIDSSGGNPVEWAVVQMGYFDEFPDWTKLQHTEDPDAFFDMENSSLSANRGALTGKQLTAQILNCYPVSNPPDQEWVFNGVVATLETGLRWNYTEDDLIAGYNDDSFPYGLSKIEAMFYQWVTRRFIRSGVEHIVTREDKKLDDGTVVDDVTISIKGYNNYFDGTTKDKEYTKLTLNSKGLMEVKDADMFGVKCFCTEALRTMRSGDVARYGMLGEVAKDSLSDIAADYQLFSDYRTSLGDQVRAFKSHYKSLRWYVMMDGNLFFYHADQKADEIFKDPQIKDMQLSGVIKLAAIYDMTMSGLRTIRCPYRRLINPMTTVLFQSRYRIIDTTGFYYQPKRTHSAFLVILSSLEFATVGPENTMTLSCVDIDDEQAPDVNFETGVVTPKSGTEKSAQTYTTSPSAEKTKRSLAWSTVKVKVGAYPYNGPGLWWTEWATLLMQSASPDDWLTPPDMARALADLKDWNSAGVWNAGRYTIGGYKSGENSLVKDLPFTLPYLYPGDTVILRSPYKSSYASAYEQKEIDLNG
jgi:hypothetical protein